MREKPLESHRDLWHQKTRVPGLSCGIVLWSYIYPFWYNIGLWRTDKQTQDHDTYCVSTESHSKNIKPGIERVQVLTDISPSVLCCHSNKTRVPIANLSNSAQLEGTPTIPPTYIQVHAVVWECGKGQTDRHTDGCDHYTFCFRYASRKM